MDYVAGRYGEPYQSAYRSDQVLQLPLKVAQGEGEWDTLGLPQALREYPPTVTAAGWMAQVSTLGLPTPDPLLSPPPPPPASFLSLQPSLIGAGTYV